MSMKRVLEQIKKFPENTHHRLGSFFDGRPRPIAIIKRNFNLPPLPLGKPGPPSDIPLAPEDDSKATRPDLIFDSLRGMWSADSTNLPVIGDFPRLARRVVVEDTKGTIMHSSPPYDPSTSNGSIETYAIMQRLLLVLIRQLETPDRLCKLTHELDTLGETITEGGDLQSIMLIILELLGEDSRVTKVLKTIHQAMILQATFEMKKTVTKDFMTKDVRTADGWQIAIRIAEFIQVRHTRREQSMDEWGITDNHWEYVWELCMTFDEGMVEMTAAQVRILTLELSESMDPKLAAKLQATVVGNNVIVM